MYLPPNMQMNDKARIAAFINRYNFAVLMSSDLQVTHLPLLFQENADGHAILLGHMAKANRHWQVMNDQRVTAVFTGPHSYISPTWYQSQPNAPTWNYAAVQCCGTFSRLDEDATRDAVMQLVAHQEPEISQDPPYWPEEYIQRLIKAVVGFTIQVDDIQAKEKLGQHKTHADQTGVYTALQHTPNLSAQKLAAYMREAQKGIGK
ncbi:FMN-binding negative transcriptional regulator [Alteromonas flava]|uniref:FMN-binding negative transcriptional regulator n=1 Tax=Alteromonas flava TaxID=2048003 RepID=UPI000C281FB5|nr:FMN-binding negative transcriptional regulator [Alteromonas flava]